ncbi:MAG: diaminopimelate epimerase [Bacteroidales bacterium]|nr:diaminopimelate epimerase [Bacteroidales bacterium]
MRLHFYKYHGAGNDFIIFDGRKSTLDLTVPQIIKLCNRHYGIGADGIMILNNTPMADFEMKFFNPDGSGGMFCGNGGRCITMFAKHIGVSKNDVFSFLAADGMHFARVVDDTNVALKMTDTDKAEIFEDGIWIDTGTSHFVCFVEDIERVDVVGNGKKLRNDKRFEKHNGANVDFVQILGDKELAIRTYERGVENETLACGTGIVASALTYCLKRGLADGKHLIKIHTLNDDLTVEFDKSGNAFDRIILTGPAVGVFDGEITI